VTRTTTSRTNAGRVTVQVRTPKQETAVLPTPVPKDVSQDQTITKTADLTDLEICKTEDATPRPDVSNGFPRPATALTGTVSARILYVPIVFTDLPFTDGDLTRIKNATDNVSKFYKETSFGRVSVSYDFLAKNLWVTMRKTATEYRLPENIPQRNNQQLVEDALALVDASVNFGLYDGVVVTSGYSQSIYGGQGFPGMTFSTNNGRAKGVSLELGTSSGNSSVMAHELGHSLFGLEDLYVFLNPTRPSVPDPQPAANWDLMSGNSSEFFGWNKLLMGWLEPNHLRCLTNQVSSSHYIETIDSPGNKPKLILINVSPGVTLAVEGRKAGVLVYKIDSRIAHGDGPILAEKRLLSSSEQLTRDSWTVRVKDSDSKGFLVEVVKR